jgi:hypothetical protein
MHEGRIVEIGRHETLLARGGSYSRLYNIQFRGQETSQTWCQSPPDQLYAGQVSQLQEPMP